jgi:hypothetical protein
VGNERYDAVAPSGNGVGSEVDGGQSKFSVGPRFRLRGAFRPPAASPYVAYSASAPVETVRPTVSSRRSRV